MLLDTPHVDKWNNCILKREIISIIANTKMQTYTECVALCIKESNLQANKKKKKICY